MEQPGSFVVEESTKATSGAAAGVFPVGVHVAGINLMQFEVVHAYWKQADPQANLLGFVYEAGQGTVFFHNTIVTNTTSVSVIAADGRSVEYAFHRSGTDVSDSLTLRDLLLPPMKTSLITSTVPGWEPVSNLPRKLAESIANIRVMISDLRNKKSIVRSEELLRLAERAATANEQPDDESLDVWARRLANDVKDAND